MEGVVTVLKPPGMTSSNAVYDARRIFGQKRAGHLGTLDPGAAGVLPVCLGRATRLFDYLVDKDKEYIFELALGIATDTQDVYGRVTAQSPRMVQRRELEALLPGFLGVQEQKASIYSALKVDGQKMYDLARSGKPVEPKSRKIDISKLELLAQLGENRFLLRIRCSRGTYVRTVCADMGERLGAFGHMAFLLRTASGPFTLENAYTIGELEAARDAGTLPERVTSCEAALAHLSALTLPKARRIPTLNGLETGVKDAPEGDVRLYCPDFLGVGRVQRGTAKLVVHLYDAQEWNSLPQ